MLGYALCCPEPVRLPELGARGFEQNLAVAVEQAMPVYLRGKIAKKNRSNTDAMVR